MLSNLSFLYLFYATSSPPPPRGSSPSSFLRLSAHFALWTVSRGISSFFLLLSAPRFRFPRRRSTTTTSTSRRLSTFRGTMHISPIFMEFLVDFFPPAAPLLFFLPFALPLFRLRARSIFSLARFPFPSCFPPPSVLVLVLFRFASILLRW